MEGTLAVARPAVNRPSRIGLSTVCGQPCGQHVHPLPRDCGTSVAIARTSLVHPVETWTETSCGVGVFELAQRFTVRFDELVVMTADPPDPPSEETRALVTGSALLGR